MPKQQLHRKRILKVPNKKTKPSITIDKLTSHFSSQFEKDENFNHSSRYNNLIGTVEINQEIKKLKNGKARGPDQVQVEDMKVGDS